MGARGIGGALERLARGPVGWRSGVAVMTAAGAMSGGMAADLLPEVAWDLLIFGPAAALALVLWLARPGTSAAPWRGLAVAFGAVTAAAALSSLTSADPARVLAQSAVLAVMAAFLLGTWRTRWTDRARLTADLLPAAGVTAGCVVASIVLGAIGIDGALGEHGRLTGVYTNPNALGMMAALLILLLLVLALGADDGGRAATRTWLLIATVPALAALVWSGSRGAALGLLIGALLTMIVRRAWGWLAGIAAVAVAVSVAVLVAAPWLLDREHYGDVTSGRITLYLELLERWTQSPVLGIGYRLADTANQFELPAHNILLAMLVETGLVGLAAFVALLVMLLRSGRAGPWLGVVVGILVIEQTESSLFGWGGPTAVAFWLVLIAHAAHRAAAARDAAPGRGWP
jgi:putative inorganic carbon (HCO3(-)) transporter